MRKVLITLAAAASALAVATPASAQWYPQPQPQYGYSYGAPYGNAYGYYNNYGQVRALKARIDALQRQISDLDRRNILSNREARSLRDQSRNLEHRLLHSSRFGLDPREMANLHYGIERLERRIWAEARDGNRYRYRGRATSWNRTHDRWHDRNDRHGH